MNPLIHTLELIINDLSHNYKDFDRTKLLKIIAQFQNQFLSLKKTDFEITSNLEELSLKQIIECQKKLHIELLSPPKQKNKSITLISGLILQNRKKKEFLEIIQPLKIKEKRISLKSPKKITAPSVSEYEDIRKLWLTNKNLSQLESELGNINMNKIRAVVKPWDVKPNGRTKIALITAVITYIKRMKKLSKLGTY